MQSQTTPEVTFKDRSIHQIHLDKGYSYVIDQNLKNFGTVISVLSKFNESILLQPTSDNLVLSASNASKSAYAKITLARSFFDRLDAQQNLPEGDIYCRLTTKSLTHIFRSAGGHSIDKIPSCTVELDPQGDFAYVHMRHQSNMRRCYVLSLREHGAICENVFSERQRLKNKVTAHAKVLLSLFSAFDCRDLELSAVANQFSARRHILREDYGKVRRTEVNIPIDHCELYHIHLPTQIVVNLRELRSILHFADSCGMAVTMHFDRPGRPLILVVEENIDFSAEFVLGTLDDPAPVGPISNQQQNSAVRSSPRAASASVQLHSRMASQTHQLLHISRDNEQNSAVRSPPRAASASVQLHSGMASQTHQLLHISRDNEQNSAVRSSPRAASASVQLHSRMASQTHQLLHISRDNEQNLLNQQDAVVGSQRLVDQGLVDKTPCLSGIGQQHKSQSVLMELVVPNAERLATQRSVDQPAQEEEYEVSQRRRRPRIAPVIEWVDPNEVSLEQYMINVKNQQRVVPRPEGMSLWEQSSEVGSSVLSARSRPFLQKTAPNNSLRIVEPNPGQGQGSSRMILDRDKTDQQQQKENQFVQQKRKDDCSGDGKKRPESVICIDDDDFDNGGESDWMSKRVASQNPNHREQMDSDF